MKKLFSLIIFFVFLLSGNIAQAETKVKRLEVLYKDEAKIHIVEGTWSMSLKEAVDIAKDYCSSLGKEAHGGRPNDDNITKFYKKKGYKFSVYKWVEEFKCKEKTHEVSNTTTPPDITFTIKDKKEQCEAIGFTPQTEKFADCVLRLVELDVKSQQQKQIELAISQGNQQVADELRAQRNQQSGEYLMNLSQQLLTPTAPASLPTTRNCSVRGTGVYKRVTCW